MRLKTAPCAGKPPSFTVLLTAAMGSLFFSELLRGRMAQAQAANDVLAHELLLSMRAAPAQPGSTPRAPVGGERGLEQFVTKHFAARRGVAPDHGRHRVVLPYGAGCKRQRCKRPWFWSAQTPALLGKQTARRINFNALADGSLRQQWAIVFGKPEVLDVVLPLERNGGPFLYAHIGVRSSLLRAAFLPWLREATLCYRTCTALLPSRRGASVVARTASPLSAFHASLRRCVAGMPMCPRATETIDAETRVSSTIAEIDRRIQVSEQQATNLSHMLHTLKDGMLLVETDGTISMMSDAVRHFLPVMIPVGTSVFRLFPPELGVETMLREALQERRSLRGVVVQVMPERDVEFVVGLCQHTRWCRHANAPRCRGT